MKTKIKLADVYLRLSVDERGGGESESIVNQRNIIKKFCDDNDIVIVKEFVDDGFSGANFERPGFKAMLEHLKKGVANTVITKDLSRLGRDMTESSYYSERYFPENGIQFITVSDNFDSEKPTPFSSLQFAINDFYVKEASSKIKQVLEHKRQTGEYCACPPFGYMKDPRKKGHIVPDPITAPIVQRMFELASTGYSSCAIADILTEEKVITPLRYRATYRDYFTEKGAARATDYWNHITVKRIIKNKVYLGHTVLGKTKKASVKSSKKITLPEEEWYITENTHTPLVSQEAFDKAQYYMGVYTKDWRDKKISRISIFRGIIFCANCGAAMCSGGTVYKGERDKYWYLYCNNISRKDDKRCEHGARIGYHHLIDLVKSELNQLINLSDEEIKKITDSAIKKAKLSEVYENGEDFIAVAKKRLLEIDKIIAKIYQDNITGLIDDDRSGRMIMSLTSEADELKKKINDLNKNSKEDNDVGKLYDKFFSLVKSYNNIEELDEDIVRTFIDRIEIGEKIYPEGYKSAPRKVPQYKQYIKIKYKFIGAISDQLATVNSEKTTA